MALSTRLLKGWGIACQERNPHFCNVALCVLHMITTTIAIADKALVHIRLSLDKERLVHIELFHTTEPSEPAEPFAFDCQAFASNVGS